VKKKRISLRLRGGTGKLFPYENSLVESGGFWGKKGKKRLTFPGTSVIKERSQGTDGRKKKLQKKRLPPSTTWDGQ